MIKCKRCGQEWPEDPALQVPCPTCNAARGKKCTRPSGHPVPGGVHSSRDQAALDAGLIVKCPGPPVKLAQQTLFKETP